MKLAGPIEWVAKGDEMDIVDGVSQTIRFNMRALMLVGALAVASMWLGTEYIQVRLRVQELEAALLQREAECAQTESDLGQALTQQENLRAEASACRQELVWSEAETDRLAAENGRIMAEIDEQAQTVADVQTKLVLAERQVAELQRLLVNSQNAVAQCVSRAEQRAAGVPAERQDGATPSTTMSAQAPTRLLAALLILPIGAVLAGWWHLQRRQGQPMRPRQSRIRPLYLRRRRRAENGPDPRETRNRRS